MPLEQKLIAIGEAVTVNNGVESPLLQNNFQI